MGEAKRRTKGSRGPSEPRVLVSLLIPKGLAQALDEMADHAHIDRGGLIVSILAQVVDSTRQMASQEVAAAPTITRREF